MIWEIYWTDKLNQEIGDEFEEFRVRAKDKKEARIKGKKKAYLIQVKEYLFRKKERISPLLKRPKLSDIKIDSVEEYN